jgi:hypothetical protein
MILESILCLFSLLDSFLEDNICKNDNEVDQNHKNHHCDHSPTSINHHFHVSNVGNKYRLDAGDGCKRSFVQTAQKISNRVFEWFCIKLIDENLNLFDITYHAREKMKKLH